MNGGEVIGVKVTAAEGTGVICSGSGEDKRVSMKVLEQACVFSSLLSRKQISLCYVFRVALDCVYKRD